MSDAPKSGDSQGVRVVANWIGALAVKLLPGMIMFLVVWFVRVEVFIGQGDRYTPTDAELQKQEILAEIEERLATLPPKPFRDVVEDIDNRTRHNAKLLGEQSIAIARIEERIESIQSAVQRILESD